MYPLAIFFFLIAFHHINTILLMDILVVFNYKAYIDEILTHISLISVSSGHKMATSTFFNSTKNH